MDLLTFSVQGNNLNGLGGLGFGEVGEVGKLRAGMVYNIHILYIYIEDIKIPRSLDSCFLKTWLFFVVTMGGFFCVAIGVVGVLLVGAPGGDQVVKEFALPLIHHMMGFK